MRVFESPDGKYRAELSRAEESAGCHGVGGYSTVTTVVRVFDRTGREVTRVERSSTEITSEHRADEVSGTTIEDVRFGEDGASIVLSLASGEELRCAL